MSRGDADRWVLGAAVLLLAATFFEPTWPARRTLVDAVVVLDVTQSMNVADLRVDGRPVSRLAFAKQALRETLLALPCGSKVGWAIFTEYRAFLLIAPIEVCAHLDELRATLAHIDGRMAWSGNSEVAKGLHSALGIAGQLADKPSLVFVTDGQEAPPLNPRHRPAFDDKPGEVPTLIVGVGATLPSPIPKTDPEGRPLGVWRADEVLQTDPRSRGRNASVDGEALVDAADGAAPAALGATPGSEHLSSLREGYLRLLAREQGATFHRLEATNGLAPALLAPGLTRPLDVRADARVPLAVLAFGLMLSRYGVPLWRALRGRAARRR